MVQKLFLFFSFLPTTLLAQEIPHELHEENESHKYERAAWIRQMHRAEPGVNTSVIDREIQNAKAEFRMDKLRGRQTSQSVSFDTIADGAITGEWSERGSNNNAGRMHCGDIDWERGLIFAASSYGNIWRGNIDGTEWTCLNEGWRFRDVRVVRLLPHNGKKRIFVLANSPASAYYSDDDGYSWNKSKGIEGPERWGYFRKCLTSQNGDTIHMLGSEWDYSSNWKSIGVIYRSIDGGSTFSQLVKGNFSVSQTDLWRSSFQYSPIYIVKQDTVGILGDDGTISYLGSNGVNCGFNSYLVFKGVASGNFSLLYLFKLDYGQTKTYASIDGGASWSLRGIFEGTPFQSDKSLAVSTTNPDSLFLGGVNLYVSGDGGSSWLRYNNWSEYYGDPEHKLHADIPAVQIFHDPTGKQHIYFMTDGGIYVSDDGLASVRNITFTDIGTSQYYDVLTSTSELPHRIYAGAQDQGFQKSTDSVSGTLGFEQTISGDYGHLSSTDSGKSVWCNYPGFSMYYPVARTSNHQRSWSFKKGNRLWLPPIVADPIDSRTAYVASGNGNLSMLWRLQYNLIGDSIEATLLPTDFSDSNKDQRISAFAISPIDHDYWYITTTDGRFYHSSDGGARWMKNDSFSAPKSHYFYGSSIVPSATKLGEVYIGGSGYSNPAVYRSADHGNTFFRADSGLPSTLVYSMATTPDGEFVFAGTEVGPYVYIRQLNQWYDMAAYSAPDHVYWSVEYIPETKTVRFGTHGRGIWDFKIEAMKNAVLAKSKSPTSGNSVTCTKTNIGYSITTNISSGANSKLRIYDIEGKIVNELYQGELSAGEQSFEWSTVNAPSGAYLVVLNADGNVAFTKLVVTK